MSSIDMTQQYARTKKALLALSVSATVPYFGWFARTFRSTGLIFDKKNHRFITAAGCIHWEQLSTIGITFHDGSHSIARIEHLNSEFGFAICSYSPDTAPLDVEEKLLEPDHVRVGMPIWAMGYRAQGTMGFTQGIVEELHTPAVDVFGSPRSNAIYIRASCASGWASGGAPVIDQNGKVVAITSSLTASDDDQMLLLPLHSVAQAIRLIEQNRYVPRGSIQLELGYRKYAEAATYLVPQSFIDRAKAEDTEYSPMAFLTASSVLKGGSSHKAGIRTGDFIIDCNGSILKTYLELQNCLDAFIGGQITLGVVRDGQRLDISVHVQDIREIESREIYQFNQAVFHRIPYRVGLDHDIPLNSGVYISSKFGHISPGQILTKLAHFSIRSVRDAFEAIHNVPHGTLVNATYFGYDRQPATTQIRIYNKNIPEVYSVLDKSNTWLQRREEISRIWSPKAPLAASTEDLDWSGQPDPSSLAHQMQLLSVTKAEEAQGRDVWRSSHVKVNVYSPLSTAAEVTMPGVFLQGGPLPTIVTTKFAGYSTMASVTITCGNKTIPAKIKGFRGLFMLVQCSAGDLPPETKPLSFGMDSCPLKVGETYTLHSFEVSNSNSTWLELPTVRQHNLFLPNDPRFENQKIESPAFDHTSGTSPTKFSSALIFRDKKENVNSSSKVTAWVVDSFYLGVNSGELVAVDLSEAKISQEANGTGTNSTGDTQTEATIQHILQTINVSEARELGMNAPTLSNIKENHRDNGETLRPVIVGPAFKGHPPSGLQEGDIVHSINGKPIFRLSDVKGLLGTNSTATASISRHRRDLEVSIALFPSRFKPLTRCLFFYGSAITPLDAGVTDSAGVVEACRIEWVKPGSPCQVAKLDKGARIISISGIKVNCIDDIIALLQEKQYPDSAELIVWVVDSTDTDSVHRIRTNDKLFPVVEWVSQEGDVPWEVTQHTGLQYNREIADGALAIS